MRTAIVTGAGSGIGRETAALLAGAGYGVVLVGRREANLRETSDSLGAGETLVCPVDLADPARTTRPVEQALERWGRVDALVNNAGGVEQAGIECTTDDLLQRMLAVNLFAPARLVARLWPVFTGQGGGCVVNVSSMATVDPFPGLSAYAAAKSALESLTRSILNEGRAHGIRAFSVAPGAVETPMLRSLWSPDELPPEQTLAPAEVARVVADCVLGNRDTDLGTTIVLRR